MENKEHPFRKDFYSLFAETQYWVYLFEDRIVRLNRTILVKDIVIAIFASTSAVSGFAFWSTTLGKYFWGFGVLLAAVFSIAGPILKLNDRVLKYQDSLTKYKELQKDSNLFHSEIKLNMSFSKTEFKTYQELVARLHNNHINRPLTGLSLKKRKEIQASVRNRIPKETFYFPELNE